MFYNFINLYVFLISFAIGIFFVYIYGPEMKEIIIYPNPENIDKLVFKDKADNCFRYEEILVECPKNSSLITEIPVQN